MTTPLTEWNALSAAEKATALRRPALQADPELPGMVREIINAVRRLGDATLRDLTKKLDGADLESLAVGAEQIAAAERELSDKQTAAIDLAITNVRRFHETQLPAAISVETMPGVRCERISHPIQSVGLYVPAGTAPLPSAAIMLAVPAAIAGCPTKVLCTPPRPDGRADPSVLVAAKRAGIDQVFSIGGAQAIAAMAFGTSSVPKVDKVFGPGNAWVTEAKTQVAADPDGAAIDMPAGPSEVLVIADENANAEFVASDLLSQAEHGTDSQVVLVTNSTEVADAVIEAVGQQLDTLDRRDIATESIRNSRFILVDGIDTAVDVSNRYAPEHLIIHTDNPRNLLGGVRNAGSIFLGRWSPESVGDYCSGTNHVLPTYGYARNFSGLGVDQFMRQMTVQELSRDGLRTIGPTVIELAGLEGLDAHAAAVRRRLDQMEQQ